ncbi:nucleolar protein 12-domain-containing protein [Gongronella butleri]|nr:nucleolar protein 12-domain-containing protein [Gongronella butleri]
MKQKHNRVKNTDLLSAGSKIYAKKRKAKKETVESVEFDFDKRQEFLTGFRKRKQERKQKTIARAKERERQEKIKFRAETKAERQRQVQTRLAEMKAVMQGGVDSEEDEDETVFTAKDEAESDDDKESAKVTEFKSNQALTTVTIIEDMTFDSE